MIRLVLRPAARQEMVDIWLYTADQWGVDQADKYIRRIEIEIQSVLEFPAKGSPVPGMPNQYRKLPSGSHRIVYRHAGEELIVVRIIHEKQDLPDEFE